ncbi:unnamed protein product [Strongylus vulgaris]|uniref:Uncharacterized protein n=1 Tax=Strongylus vulgaris TaxID=40348 RepID=A0A3P7KCM9_STRVU|nr:unnamed protein product [Strongylus vulgaris]
MLSNRAFFRDNLVDLGTTLIALTAEQMVADEVVQMNEYTKKSNFQAKELNAKITTEKLKAYNGELYFTSGRFGAVFLLPGASEPHKTDADMSEAPSHTD